MKVYFTASIVGKKKYLKEYITIIRLLAQKDCIVVADHIIQSSEHAINLETEQEREQFHKKLRHWITDAHCVVVEASFPSISVGFEISLALQCNKPVLVLYRHEAPTLLAGYQNEQLICERYTMHTLGDCINDFLAYVQDASEHRFTFFISAKQAQFLEEISRKNRVPKSVYMRQLIDAARHGNNASW